MTYKINVKYLLGVLMLMTFLVASANQPQSLDDWKAALSAAQSEKGCESIPYSDYREQCTKKSEKVDEFCKTDSWNCDVLGTKSLRGNIKNLSEHIERLKTEKDRLNSQKSSAGSEDEKNQIGKKIEETEKQIYEKTKELDYMKRSLETDLGDIEIRLYKGNQCLDVRTEVQKIFSDVARNAKGESDPRIKAIATQLIDYWEKKAIEHGEAFKLVKAGIENCQKSKSGDL